MPTDTIQIKPSAGARQLFNVISARSEDKHLNYDSAIKLTIERANGGIHNQDHVRELLREGWIKPAEDGGLVVAL